MSLTALDSVLFSGPSPRHSMFLTALSTPPEVPVFSSLSQHTHPLLSRSCLFYPNTPSFISLPKENKWNLFWQDSLFKPILVPRDYPCLLFRSSYNCHRSVSFAHIRASDSQLLFFEAFSVVLDGEQCWLQVTGTHQDTGSYLRSWISQLPELEICKEMRKESRKFLFKFNVGKMFWLLFSSFSNIYPHQHPVCSDFVCLGIISVVNRWPEENLSCRTPVPLIVLPDRSSHATAETATTLTLPHPNYMVSSPAFSPLLDSTLITCIFVFIWTLSCQLVPLTQRIKFRFNFI